MTFVSRAASRQAVAAGGSHFGGLRCAQTPLRCSIRGCAAELAARCALRSNSRGESVTKRALRANPESALLATSEIAPPPPGAKPGLRNTYRVAPTMTRWVRGATQRILENRYDRLHLTRRLDRRPL